MSGRTADDGGAGRGIPTGKTMELRGIDFGHVLDASGVRGWFGEGHPFHRWIPFGFDFTGSTFVAKTATLAARDPHGTLARDGRTVRVLRQPTVRVDWRRAVVLNALGLPGPGLEALLADGRWQRRREPFFLSFTALAETAQGRADEARRAVGILRAALPRFAAPVGLQVNWSCPNVPHGGTAEGGPTAGDGTPAASGTSTGGSTQAENRIAGFRAELDEYGALDVPVMVKLSVTQPVEDAHAIAEHPACDALCVSNTAPWGELPDRIDWVGLFGKRSPLASYGGGGLSGAPLLPLVAEWVAEARRQGVTKPINAGGGILRPKDADVLQQAGASSVFVGSIAILRGWRLARTIRHANRLFAAAAPHARQPTDAGEQVAEAPRTAPHAPRPTAAGLPPPPPAGYDGDSRRRPEAPAGGSVLR